MMRSFWKKLKIRLPLDLNRSTQSIISKWKSSHSSSLTKKSTLIVRLTDSGIYGFLPFILHQIEHGEMKASERVKKLKTVFTSWRNLIIDFLQEKSDFFAFIDAT